MINSRDVTERKRMEQRLRDNEARLQDFLDSASDLIQSVTPDGRFLYVNRAWRETLGYSADEVSALSLFDVLHPDCEDACMSALERALAGEPVHNVEATFVAKDGRAVVVTGSANSRFKDGEPTVTRGIFRDVTERKRAEEALRQSEQRYRTLVEQMPATTYVQNPAKPGRPAPTVYASPQIEAQTGYPPEAFVEDPELWIKLVHPDDYERVLAEELRTEETGDPFEMEYRIIRRDGSVVWLRDEAVLVRDEEGRPLFWQGIELDVTARKEAEEALRESEERHRTVLEQIEDGYFEVDLAGNLTFFNDSVVRMLGYPGEELMGMNNRGFIDGESAEKVYRHFNRVYRTGEPLKGFDWELTKKDGASCSSRPPWAWYATGRGRRWAFGASSATSPSARKQNGR